MIRFVPAPDGGYRGYDLDLRRVVVGAPTEPTVFLRLHDPINGLERGSPVLVVATVNSQNPQVLTPGPCPPIQQISEAEFIRWAGEP